MLPVTNEKIMYYKCNKIGYLVKDVKKNNRIWDAMDKKETARNWNDLK